MEKEIRTITVLRASEGMMLTNGEAYGKTVALGATDKAENWREITMEEYERKMAETEIKE
jgi:hypothetical protein